MARTRRLTLAALLVLAASLATAARSNAFVIGVGDQQPSMFTDPRFVALGIHYARLSVAWDVFESRSQSRTLATWMRLARADGVQPLVSFDHHQPSSRGHKLPTVGQLVHEFRIFRRRYPWVKTFATWNEADYCGEPTCHEPALVAAYYRALRRACPTCTILGAELLDEPNMIEWVREFDHALGRQPGIWGLHNYIGANRLQVASTRALLRATRSEIWFTETGGVVSRNNESTARFPENPRHAAKVTSFILGRLAHLSRRITRVYIYQWSAPTNRRPAWDSGLLGPAPAFSERPAFSVFVDAIAAQAHPPLSRAGAQALLDTRASAVVGALLDPAASGSPPRGDPVAGRVEVRTAGGERIVASATVSAGEHFVLAVKPGSYIVSATTSGGPCLATRATVRRGHDLVADLICPPAPSPPSTATTSTTSTATTSAASSTTTTASTATSSTTTATTS